jgi:hypothetical protein
MDNISIKPATGELTCPAMVRALAKSDMAADRQGIFWQTALWSFLLPKVVLLTHYFCQPAPLKVLVPV